MPTVLLPVADPRADATVAAPPAATEQFEYVYLSRVVLKPPQITPSVNMPTAPLPAAEPCPEADVAAPPALTAAPEYVYLLRVATGSPEVEPIAKIANVPSADGVTLLLNALIGEGP